MITPEVRLGAESDIKSWMGLVRGMRDNFPGLETEEGLDEYRSTALEFMREKRALCVKEGAEVVGVLLFSRTHNMICCLAVSAEHRRKGIASALITKALGELDRSRDITVTTFRKDDPRGGAPRALYKKFGFAEGELVVEFGCPSQVFVLAGKPPRNAV
ncbi:MAG: GNAT family N-acetyltransferase [Lachnospiraceae bacterium]|nr:GNAT family N-acetyltransferase [Ruminococcus sp.]MCM1276000.1 GNAT family N-acetyltransferase [Lachnospiraceae bacterium]